jgi:hypothetical protein
VLVHLQNVEEWIRRVEMIREATDGLEEDDEIAPDEDDEEEDEEDEEDDQ